MKFRMKKEVLIAVLVGLTMGLIITYGVYRVRVSGSNPHPGPNLQTSPEPSSEAPSAILSISSPLEGAVLSATELTVSGTTLPQAFVVIFVNDIEHITTADATGNFSVSVTLTDGANIINVVVAGNDGKTYNEYRTVVVSEALDELQTASASAQPAAVSPSPSAKASVKPSPSSKTVTP